MISDKDKLEFIEDCLVKKGLDVSQFGNGANFWKLEKFDIMENNIKVEVSYKDGIGLIPKKKTKIWSCPKDAWLKFIRPRTINSVIGKLS